MIITENTINKVYRCKLASVDTMQLRGYELIDELFVDSSGWGLDSEPALTTSRFEKRLLELVREHGSLTAKITSQGQFQVYIGLFKKTGKSKIEKVSNNTYKIPTKEGYKIRLHDTDVIEFKDDQIILDTGGYYTHTTKKRMNEWLPSRYYVYQKDFSWYVKDTEKNKDIIFNGSMVTL